MMNTDARYIQREFTIGDDRVRPGNILVLKNYRKIIFQYLMSDLSGKCMIVGLPMNGAGGSLAVPIETLRGLHKPKRSRKLKPYV